MIRELRLRAPGEVVVPERRVEERATGELRKLHGRDGATAGRLRPPTLGVDDLARDRDVPHGEEVDPLDVPDDREAVHESLT